MPKFEVVSEYKPSGEPHRSCAFAGAAGVDSNGQAEPAHFKVLAAPKHLTPLSGGGP